MTVRNPCQSGSYVEGSARPGTQPSVSDPCNILGGAQYEQCGKESVSKYLGRWYCEEHLEKCKEAVKYNERQTR